MKLVATLVAIVVIAPLALLLVGRMGLLAGKPPADLGVKEGRFKPPSRTANSVSSQATLYPDHPQLATARIDPLPLRGDSNASLAKLRTALEATEGVRIVQAMPDYLRAEGRTKWMGYVDDLEFWIDPAQQVIQLRSASRLGQLDFGANRKRIEAIRQVYMAAG